MKYCILFIALVLLSCKGGRHEVNKFSDAELIKIYDWQDKRLSDSLALYFQHADPTYRRHAALAFASVQDTLMADSLGHLLLSDADEQVRIAAAFALGQSPCRIGANQLTTSLTKEKSESVLRYVLEALGNTLPSHAIASLVDYLPQSSQEEEGKAWGLYKLGLRSITSPEVIKAALQGLASQHAGTRLASAHFFSRSSLKDFTDSSNLLLQASRDTDVFVRTAATLGLRHLKTDAGRTALIQCAKDKDERVRVNALRALRTFPFDQTADAYLQSLNDSSHQVRVACAELVLTTATVDFANAVYQAATRATDWRVQATLFETVAKLQPTDTLFSVIKSKYTASSSTYQKAALLSALGRSATNFSFVGSELTTASDPIILSSAALSLSSCNNAVDFNDNEKPAFLSFYKKAIERGDAAVTGIIAQILGDSTKKYKPLLTDITFLKDARDKLSLPKDNEALQPIEAAIAYIEGRQPEEVKNTYNHPIDWNVVRSIPTDQKAIIQTTQGAITLRLFVDESPGSVANFVTLTRQGYFNGKFFHRIVPNFVIQAGCVRGDGWGSEDYSIRSEFTLRSYREGSVGMASAGKDTEGTQWFITHSPTPHLNGRYSIFAEVTEGMNVVNAIGVGDKITNIQLTE
jgi:cyclophilin family peptidyl-prolyl cis-trans isomerase/HEAT repeat protein